jgi:hypothetical protein
LDSDKQSVPANLNPKNEKLRNCLCVLISFFFPVICGAGMTGDLRQIPLGALTVSVRLRAELAPTAQTPAESELGCMWCATFATIT